MNIGDDDDGNHIFQDWVKSHIAALRRDSIPHAFAFPGRAELCSKFGTRASGIESTSAAASMHIHMDCFFAMVGLRDRPHLRGQPVVVTHSKKSGTRSRYAGFPFPHLNWNKLTQFESYHASTMRILGLEATDPQMTEIASRNYEALGYH